MSYRNAHIRNMTHAEFKLHMRAYQAILRCYNTKHRAYRWYGARGITVHPDWRDNVKAFAEYLKTLPGWDDPNLVLDRKENDGNYEPGNLRFVTYEVSINNRRPFAETQKQRERGRFGIQMLQNWWNKQVYVPTPHVPFDVLTELELYVTVHRFLYRETLDCIAQELNYTRQGISVVQQRALRKLREAMNG